MAAQSCLLQISSRHERLLILVLYHQASAVSRDSSHREALVQVKGNGGARIPPAGGLVVSITLIVIPCHRGKGGHDVSSPRRRESTKGTNADGYGRSLCLPLCQSGSGPSLSQGRRTGNHCRESGNVLTTGVVPHKCAEGRGPLTVSQIFKSEIRGGCRGFLPAEGLVVDSP